MATQNKVLKKNVKLTKPSFIISHHISKCQAPFTIGEKLLIPSIVSSCSEMLGLVYLSFNWMRQQILLTLLCLCTSDMLMRVSFIRISYSVRRCQGPQPLEKYSVCLMWTSHGMAWWRRCVGVCKDGVAAMTGTHHRVAQVKAVSPLVQAIQMCYPSWGTPWNFKSSRHNSKLHYSQSNKFTSIYSYSSVWWDGCWSCSSAFALWDSLAE